jgi:Transposase DDE domain group 1
MEDDSTTAQAATLFTGEAWFDPIEAGIRERIRGFIEALFEEELTTALGRGRCERAVLEPVIARYRGIVKHLYFRGDAAFANPEVYEFLEAESASYAIRLPANPEVSARSPGAVGATGTSECDFVEPGLS